MSVKNVLLTPFKLSENLIINNRLAVAPLTRRRADMPDHMPNELMAEYYAQRAQFGLIITECSPVSQKGASFDGCGGIYTLQHVDHWRRITDKVHEKGGKIIQQIWHGGRATPKELIDGNLPLGASPIPISGVNPLTNKPYDIPRELHVNNVRHIQEQFVKAAEYAKLAGFDGVQLHGANGYLIDQFLKDYSNKRIDKYGGSIQNRCRFLLEIIDQMTTVMPSNEISVRLSPTGRFQDQYDSDPLALMQYLLPELSKRNLQFLELKRHGALDTANVNAQTQNKLSQNAEKKDPEEQIPNFFSTLRPLYKGTLMANDGITVEEAQKLISKNLADLVSFGNLSISNPDLPARIEHNWPLNTDNDRSTYYTPGAKGYTDYPFYKEKLLEQDKQKQNEAQIEA